MAKRWIVLLLAVAVALAVVPLATAGPGGGWAHGKKKFNLVGTVVAPDATAGTLTVKVKAGTRSARGVTKSVKKWRGEEMTVNVDVNTKIRLVTADGCTTVPLADIPLNAKVKVRGTIKDSVFTATWIKAKTMPTREP